MSDTVDMYRISNMDVYAGPTVGKASNYLLAERLVRGKSRVEMKLLSNSEQRFLSYMAVASRADFDKYISKSAVLVDIGGASLQITLFINGKVETTQHINIGTAIMRENLRRLSHYIDRKRPDSADYEQGNRWLHQYVCASRRRNRESDYT